MTFTNTTAGDFNFWLTLSLTDMLEAFDHMIRVQRSILSKLKIKLKVNQGADFCSNGMKWKNEIFITGGNVKVRVTVPSGSAGA